MGQRVLLVDDDGPMRALTRATLEHAGFEVAGEAADGGSALVLAARLRPDLVLLDVIMPGVNGFEILAEMRRLLPKARIIVMSMLGEALHSERAHQMGADAYIDKATPASGFVALVRDNFRKAARPAGPST